MLISQTALAVIRAAEETTSPEPINHWIIGGGILLLLLAVLAALVIFGGGRDHT